MTEEEICALIAHHSAQIQKIVTRSSEPTWGSGRKGAATQVETIANRIKELAKELFALEDKRMMATR
jgi:hypothetical protein